MGQSDAGLDDLARAAYCSGWALSGAGGEPPAAELQAAAAFALDCAHDPHVLEATLLIGSLRGTWKRFFRRREDLTATHTATVLKAWEAVAPHAHVGPLLDRLRAEVGPQQPQDDGQRAYLRTLTGTAAASLVAGAYAHDKHADFQAAVQDALRAAMAEGKAGALAIHAEKHGHVAESEGKTYGWDSAHQAIYDELQYLPNLPLLAQQWVQRMLAGMAGQIGRLLARLFEEGASKDEMASAVADALDASGEAPAGRAVTLFTDLAMAQAMTKASLDLYASEGLGECSFVTAGDARVDAICADYEAGNPYSPQNCPVPPHPRCRCVVMPAGDLTPFQALAAHLT